MRPLLFVYLQSVWHFYYYDTTFVNFFLILSHNVCWGALSIAKKNCFHFAKRSWPIFFLTTYDKHLNLRNNIVSFYYLNHLRIYTNFLKHLLLPFLGKLLCRAQSLLQQFYATLLSLLRNKCKWRDHHTSISWMVTLVHTILLHLLIIIY